MDSHPGVSIEQTVSICNAAAGDVVLRVAHRRVLDCRRDRTRLAELVLDGTRHLPPDEATILARLAAIELAAASAGVRR